MSISALGSSTTGSSGIRLVPLSTSGFGAQVAMAVGQGHAGHGAHGHRTQDNGTQETGAPAIPAPPGGPAGAPVHTQADDARALVGDVFGALGADTPTAVSASQAIAAYRRAG